MAINDTGIVEFQWFSPDKLLNTVSQDVQTLPFEQVMQTFEKQFFIRNALKSAEELKPNIPEGMGKDGSKPPDYSVQLRAMGIFTPESIGSGEQVKACTYNIERATLSLTRIAVKDHENEFMIVPAWDFFGSAKVEYNPDTGYKDFIFTSDSKSFLTINAIDGSIISREYGY